MNPQTKPDLQFRFYPKRLLLTALFIAALGAVLSTAAVIKSGGALGLAGLVAYTAFDLFFSVNPAGWQRHRSSASHPDR